MKKIRITAIAIAMLMLCMTMAACNAGSPKVSATFTLSVVNGDEVYVDGYSYTVEGTEAEPPTVLQGVREALQTLDIATEADSENLSLASLTYDGVTYENYSSDGANIYAWIYSINGEEATGRAGMTTMQDGWNIEYSLLVTPIENQQFSDSDEEG